MILGAIDIGSNAARLLITQVVEQAKSEPEFLKLNLVRVPLRLGFDVFETGSISPKRTNMLTETMSAFSSLMRAYEVVAWRACATSAMRDAKNSSEIIQHVHTKTGINIEVITGDTEANLIYENHVAEYMDKNNSYLYIDVGGGSTELSFFSNGILIFKRSFDIGTIRLLKNQVQESTWEELKNTTRAVTKGHKQVIAIGSGGNINKVFALSKRKEGKPLPLDLLRDYYKELSSFNIDDRMKHFDLKADRADVILPALSIYISVMRWANATEIFVPKIGLADGLTHHLYDELKKKS